MKYLPPRTTHACGPHGLAGYNVTLPDGAVEWYPFAWQAMARAKGWSPPTEKERTDEPTTTIQGEA